MQMRMGMCMLHAHVTLWPRALPAPHTPGLGWRLPADCHKDPRAPLASPVHADLRGLPPLLLQVGSIEVLLDDTIALAQKAKAAGVAVDLEVWDDMPHIWQQLSAILPEGQQAIDRIGEFLREHAGQ